MTLHDITGFAISLYVFVAIMLSVGYSIITAGTYASMHTLARTFVYVYVYLNVCMVRHVHVYVGADVCAQVYVYVFDNSIESSEQ